MIPLPLMSPVFTKKNARASKNSRQSSNGHFDQNSRTPTRPDRSSDRGWGLGPLGALPQSKEGGIEFGNRLGVTHIYPHSTPSSKHVRCDHLRRRAGRGTSPNPRLVWRHRTAPPTTLLTFIKNNLQKKVFPKKRLSQFWVGCVIGVIAALGVRGGARHRQLESANVTLSLARNVQPSGLAATPLLSDHIECFWIG
jgi:hypothetical protein